MIDKPLNSTNNQKNLQLTVTGKILRTRRYDGSFYSAVICPAKDEYSRPSVVEIRSQERLGDVEDVIKDVLCDLSGFEGRAYRVTDRDTGEARQIKPVNHFLDAVGR